MIVTRPVFTSPIICIDNFLSEAEADTIYQEFIDLKKVFMPSRVFDTSSTTKIDLNIRNNEVAYIGDIFRDAPQRSNTLSLLRAKIWTDECRAIWHEGDYIFDVINYATSHEVVLSRYGQGNFYDFHRDTRQDHITNRIVTLVYYVSTVPTHFTGGELVLEKEERRMTIEPRHNRAVVFPSFHLHGVAPISMQNENWENGRFSVNYWLGFR